MALPPWDPPKKILPSQNYLGEISKDALHLAAGAALNEWEILESALARIFGHMVESKSPAAQRAYGTILAGLNRKEALEAAAIEFFRTKPDPMMADFYILFAAYGAAATAKIALSSSIARLPFWRVI